MKKKIGMLFGLDITLSTDSKIEEKLFNELVERACKTIGSNQYINWYGHDDGHRPEFYEKYPQLVNFKEN